MHIAILSTDERLLTGGSARDHVSALAPDVAIEQVARLGADVYVVDARGADRSPLVGALAEARVYPIIVVGEEHEAAQATRYLDAGADDYLSLDTRAPELGARIRAAIRRRPQQGELPVEEDYVLGDVTISLDRHEVLRGGKPVRLTPTEFRLLAELVAHANEVVSHRKLMAAVWGLERLSSKHYLRVYIRQLRKKLEDDPDAPERIVTVWGRGYALRCDERTSA